MILNLAEQFGYHLQGKLPGKLHFAKLCQAFSGVEPSSAVFLDFEGVEIVTASWINATFTPFFQWVTSEDVDLFPVVCNLEDSHWVDEFSIVATWTRRCFLIRSKAMPDDCVNAVGPLDQSQLSTLSAIQCVGAATGAEMARSWTLEKVQATAWNNRLKDLYDKRLVRRVRKGREQVYSAVFKEIKHLG